MVLLGLGFLSWYYSNALSRPANAKQAAQTAVKSKAQGEMPLPALGPLDPPESTLTENLLGPKPEISRPKRVAYAPAASEDSDAYSDVPDGQGAGSRRRNRRLDGPVFAAAEAMGGSGAIVATASAYRSLDQVDAAGTEGAGIGAPALGGLLQPSISPAVRARVLPSQQMLLPKGAFIDCTLETAIDSSLPGLTTCVTATDTFGADGRVVLLERGTKLVGETRGEVQQGSARIFVLWTEARTPTGVVVPLASPGTDELGRSGLPGEVNRHFLQRFGAAILISVIDGAVQSAVQSGNRGAVVYNPTSSQSVLTEILKGTIAIAPTVNKRNGDRIQVLVARDLDFRSVYELRTVAQSH
jgi:type IV secretion system protein VirB10